MSETEYEPITCPVDDCTYRDQIRSVAAHVSGTDDAAHDWDALGYEGAASFVRDAKRRQQGDASAASAASGRSESADPDGIGETTHVDDAFLADALAAAQLLDEYGTAVDDLNALQLTDLYVLLSDLRAAADVSRKTVRDELTARLARDREVASDIGAVRHSTHKRTELRDEETVTAALADAGIDPETVSSPDASKVREAIETAEIDTEQVFETRESTRVTRTDIDESAVAETATEADPADLLD